MQNFLQTQGIPVKKVRRRGGHYVAEFFNDDFGESVDKGVVWADKIKAVLPDAIILNTHDTIASWRLSLPIIFTAVVFEA